MKQYIAIFLVLLISTAIFPISSITAAAPMKVHYINVGQGDATYIKMPGGEDILIDGGRQGQGKIINA